MLSWPEDCPQVRISNSLLWVLSPVFPAFSWINSRPSFSNFFKIKFLFFFFTNKTSFYIILSSQQHQNSSSLSEEHYRDHPRHFSSFVSSGNWSSKPALAVPHIAHQPVSPLSKTKDAVDLKPSLLSTPNWKPSPNPTPTSIASSTHHPHSHVLFLKHVLLHLSLVWNSPWGHLLALHLPISHSSLNDPEEDIRFYIKLAYYMWDYFPKSLL